MCSRFVILYVSFWLCFPHLSACRSGRVSVSLFFAVSGACFILSSACQCLGSSVSVLRFVSDMWTSLGAVSVSCELVNSLTLLVCSLSLLAWSLHARTSRMHIATRDMGVQTHAVTPVTPSDFDSIWVTEFGERFHCSAHCKGLDARNTKYRFSASAPCTAFAPDEV